jgi:hypothetical protein
MLLYALDRVGIAVFAGRAASTAARKAVRTGSDRRAR